jgi:MATE family multidrug resistance protein
LLPLLLFTALRRYLLGIGAVKAIMVTLVTANVVNLAGNWIFVFGNLGAPAMGAPGSAYATLGARIYMLGALVAYVIVREWGRSDALWRVSWMPDVSRLASLVRLGGPAALQTTLEVGVFATATMLAGRLAASSLAAHQVALAAAALTFMVPLGVSSAGAVMVAQALGRGDPEAANRAGWMSLMLGGTFMLGAALVFVTGPEPLVRVFTTDAAVVASAVSLLAVGALFQLFDGLQVVATGVLRGTGDTRTPMVANLIGHWFIGLPLGWLLCFRYGWDIVGLWLGLSAGLIVVALALVWVWARRAQELAGEVPAMPRVA